MAKKAKKFSVQSYDNKHYRMTEQYTKAVDRLFDSATTSIAEAAANGKYDPDKPFSFDDHPKVKSAMQEVTNQLASRMQVTIETGSRAEWLAACDKNDAFLNSIMDTSKLSKSTLSKMTDQNLDALSAFQQRKVDGMDLSTRVWNYVGQYREQIEQALDVGLGEGRSAQQLARDVKKNLKEPNRLFRRVRDKRGNLVLSKNARAFHPGQGVYRSSVKNAQRLTRSEINMAYRTSDYERWQRLDFIVGFEILRSNHDPLCKCSLCEQLKGRYPKEFKFVGWHPQCMCYAIPVMMDEQTIDENEAGDLKAALFGTKYEHKAAKNGITDVPQGFKDWMKANASKQKDWASSPYFVRDNFKNGTIADGLSLTVTPSPIAKVQPVKVDPKEQELNALAPQIEEIRQLCQEWGITTAWIDRAVADKNIEEIREAIAVLRRDIDNSRGLFSQYEKSAKEAIAQAKARGVDASAVEADLQAVSANHKLWNVNAPSYQQRLYDLQQTPGTGTVQLRSSYTTTEEVDETFAELNKIHKWFVHGDLKLMVTKRGGVNGCTDMSGRVYLTSSRLEKVKVALGKIGSGQTESITSDEADAMATFWHEITHNRNIPGNVHGVTNTTALQTKYMELSNEFVARHTLSEFYEALGAKKMPYPEFQTSRASTGYDGMVTNYDFVIKKLGLNFDKVCASVRDHLFHGNYNDQVTGLRQGLIAGGLKYANGTPAKASDVNSLVKIIQGNDDRRIYDWETRTYKTKEEVITEWLIEKGFLRK